ncbi:AraC family transcriptional regulator [Cerasicoccus maritimus]|uniref:AraC family transcriptional regulator n=1 Tax=Cerasicoccus maritimus TaxID=490089 RepID=UPI002852D514|nr:AraC family transcriptional regulator [Cerasicoccus maritimus]
MESKASFQQQDHQQNESFRFFELEGDRFDTPFHHHDEIELTLIAEGVGLRLVGDSIAIFKKGDLCLLGGGLPHKFHSIPSGTQPRAYVLQFRRDCCGGVIDDSPELARVAAMLDGANRGLQFGIDAATVTAGKLNSLRSAIDHEIICQFLSILGLLSKTQGAPLSSESYCADRNAERTARMHQAYNYILNNVHHELPQSLVAQQLGMEREAFGKFFQRQANQSYRHFVQTTRLSLASLLLLHTDRGIANIAEAVGFGNQTNFNRCFRSRYHASPRTFRKIGKEVKAERKLEQFLKPVERRKMELHTQLTAIRAGLGL